MRLFDKKYPGGQFFLRSNRVKSLKPNNKQTAVTSRYFKIFLYLFVRKRDEN